MLCECCDLQKGNSDRHSPLADNAVIISSSTTSAFTNGTKSKREKNGSRIKDEYDVSSNRKRKRVVASSERDEEEERRNISASPTHPLSLSKLNNVKISKEESEKEASQHHHPADLISNGNKSFSDKKEEEIEKNGLIKSPSFGGGENKYPVMLLPKPDLKMDTTEVDEEDEEVDVHSNEDDESITGGGSQQNLRNLHYHQGEDDEPGDHSHQSHYQHHMHLDEMGQPTRKLRRSRTTFTTFQLHQLERAFEKTQYPVSYHFVNCCLFHFCHFKSISVKITFFLFVILSL